MYGEESVVTAPDFAMVMDDHLFGLISEKADW